MSSSSSPLRGFVNYSSLQCDRTLSFLFFLILAFSGADWNLQLSYCCDRTKHQLSCSPPPEGDQESLAFLCFAAAAAAAAPVVMSLDEDARWLEWVTKQFESIAGDDKEIDLDEFKTALKVKEVLKTVIV